MASAARGGGGRRGSGVGRGRDYGRGGRRGGRGVAMQMEGLSIREEAAPASTGVGTPAVYKKASPLPSRDNLKALKPPKRPGLGTAGRRSTIRANHFAVELTKALHIFHYDVSIDLAGASRPVSLPLGLNRAVLRMTVQQYGESHLGGRLLAYDGMKNVYTAGSLPLESQMFVVKLLRDKDGQEEYNVTIRFAARIDLQGLQQFLAGKVQECPQDTIQALDVVLRTLPSLTHVTVARSFFFKDPGNNNHTGLGNGVECWKGYYQSLRPTQMGLSLNVDQSATSFLEPKMVVEFMREYLNLRDVLSRPLSAADSVKIKKVMRNVKIDTPHRPGSFYRIRGLSALPAHQLKFSHNGQDVSVVQYFKETYSIHLEYPSLPCLIAGSDKKPSYLPMELCRIVAGQRYARKLNERQIRTMLGLTCAGPTERERTITRMVAENRYQMDPLVADFGINVSNDHAALQARVLAPPTLKYGGNRNPLVCPNMGKWNMMEKQLESGAKVEFWAFLNLSSRIYRNVAETFCWGLVDKCQQMGMQFNPSPVVMNCNPHVGETVDAALRNLKVQSDQSLARMGKMDKNLQLLIIILPDQSGYYGCIKRICETELGIVSQCCQPRNVPKNDGQYFENVAMKINVKVGGRNTVVNEYLRPVRNITDEVAIIFGADVTHPSPGEDSSPSIAAVVASMDWPGMASYRCLVSSQAHRQEIISDLYTSSADAYGNPVSGGMIRDLLRSFYALNQHRKPTRIIFYRDGVSEGQFQDVLLYEMHAIHKACTSMEENYRPKVTFIVVQKRHHTRLFPTRDGVADRSGNVVPGTVVDTKICHPTEFDFYLCSHAGIKGTSRPTHYHVLYDENKFSADALQSFTNNLCYTFARCTRSVSVVPAAYYAHLAAYRARYYIEGDASDGGSTVPKSVGSGEEALVRDLPKIKDNVKEFMFFC